MLNPRLHMRRCHHCGHLNEADSSLVVNCYKCSKNLERFHFFDEIKAIGLKTEEQAALEYKSSALPWREYPPILGLTAYWEINKSESNS